MRRATLLAAGALALASLGVPALAAPEDVPDEGSAETSRVEGATRYHTAADTALTAHPDGVDTVLVATGENFPDALAASYLAGRQSADNPYPILLTHPTFLPGPTQNAIEQLDPERVIILGQTTAVTRDVQGELEALVDDVRRIGGADRVKTAAAIAHRGGDIGAVANQSDDESDEELTTAIVARADNFPDALASGPLALEGRHPILLTDTGTLPAATRDVLTDEDLGIQQVIIAGGPSAVNENVAEEIADLDNIVSVARVQGEVRTETAVEMAELTRDALGWSAETISLARGDLYPDALTLAPLAAMQNASMYLTGDPGTLSAETFRGIQEICGENDHILISGGPDAVSAQAEGEAKQASLCATEFTISADQSVGEAGKPGAEGTGWYTVVGDTICVAYDVDGLDGQADASHIHEGDEGEAPANNVVVDLGAPNPQGFLATCVEDAEQAANILADPTGYYVNVHTTDYPQGAARGQLVEPGETPEPIALDEQFSVFGDAVLGDTGVAGYVAGATLAPNEEGQLCLTLTDEDDATMAANAQLFEGAVDVEADGDPVASWEEITEDEQHCTEVTDPSVLTVPFQGDQFYLSVDTVDGDEIARGQVAPTQEAELAVEGDDTLSGTAQLFRGAEGDVLCGAVATIGTTPNADPDVVTHGDGETDSTFAFDAAVDWDCDDEDVSAEDAVDITVPTDDGDLTGAFGEQAPVA